MKSALTAIFFCLAITAIAQIPPGYYDSAQGLNGHALRTALHDIIDDHDVQSYSSLWNHLEDTDNKGGNTVWDMYSDQPGGTPDYEYQFGSDQCGSYGGEGDCFNREHSFPQSWYGNGAPMESDLFHVYPTDGYVNGQRDSDPYGEVDGAFWTSTNGGKSGPNVFPGFVGTVFEPIDEYKGDLARGYFYMLTRYMDISGGWNSPMLNMGNFSGWAAEMLIQWHLDDPVSAKEIDRNNAVHDIQDNRNPYIDNPEWATAVWPVFVGIKEVDIEQGRIWYADGQLHFSNFTSNRALSVFNVQGQKVLHVEATTNTVPVSLNPGVYMVVCNETASTLKIVVSDVR